MTTHEDLPRTESPADGELETGGPGRERWSGFILAMKLHLIAIPVFLAVLIFDRDKILAALLSFCLWQWVYLLPAMIRQYAEGRSERGRGVLIGGIVTMAVASALWFIVLTLLCFGVVR